MHTDTVFVVVEVLIAHELRADLVVDEQKGTEQWAEGRVFVCNLVGDDEVVGNADPFLSGDMRLAKTRRSSEDGCQ